MMRRRLHKLTAFRPVCRVTSRADRKQRAALKVVLAKTEAALEQVRSEVSVLRLIGERAIRGCIQLADSHEEPSQDGTLVFMMLKCAPNS